ncbi:MAG: hypothetical protein WCG16_05335 [Methylococcales bacterium]
MLETCKRVDQQGFIKFSLIPVLWLGLCSLTVANEPFRVRTALLSQLTLYPESTLLRYSSFDVFS